MFKLTDKTALVTGASRGIGKAIALRLAEQGAHVVVGYGKNAGAADEVVAEIQAKGGSAESFGVDMGDWQACEKEVGALAKKLGRLDILVANAGISIDGLMLKLSEEAVDKTLAVNVKGSLACAKAAVRSMMRKKFGRIIFISSVVGETGNAGQVADSGSKAALTGIAKSLAREYASRKITVNVVTPGWVDTDMTRALPEKVLEQMAQDVPLGRAAQADEIAGPVAFLASDEAAYITGAVLRVNGGMLM